MTAAALTNLRQRVRHLATGDGLKTDVGFQPETTMEPGVGRFVKWYREFYGV